MPKNIFISVILLVSISLGFTGNACSFIHLVGEDEVSLLARTFKEAKTGVKRWGGGELDLE